MKVILLIALVVASCTFTGCQKKKKPVTPEKAAPTTTAPAKT